MHLPWTAQQYENARSELHPNENERENLIMHVHSSTVEHVLQNGVTSRAFHRHFWGGHGAYLSESVDANIEVEYGEFCSGGALRSNCFAMTRDVQEAAAMHLYAKRSSAASSKSLLTSNPWNRARHRTTNPSRATPVTILLKSFTATNVST